MASLVRASVAALLCTTAAVLTVRVAQAAVGDQILNNGCFANTPIVGNVYRQIDSPDATKLAPWDVTSGSVDQCTSGLWQSAPTCGCGGSLDVAGSLANWRGVTTQTLTVTPDTYYNVSCYTSGNYFNFEPPARSAEFQFAGDVWNWTFTRPPTWSTGNMGYILQYRIVKTPSAMTNTAMTITALPAADPNANGAGVVLSDCRIYDLGPTPAPNAAVEARATSYNGCPSAAPTGAPTAPTQQPSLQPTAPTQVPSLQPSQAPSTAPTTQPSKAPTTQPTTAPSKAPSQQPSQAPSASPSQQPSGAPTTQPSGVPTTQPSRAPTPVSPPTTAPTSFPTFAPPPTDNSWQPVATSYVCEAEIFLEQRRELEGHVEAQPQSRAHHGDERQLRTWTPDQCFEACAARLNNPPTFVINIYYNETARGQVCTCCRECKSLRYVPGAQIFATCATGAGASSMVRFQSSIKPKQRNGVKPGKLVTYHASIKNVDKAAVVQGLAVTVQLPPAGVTYLQSKASGAYAVVVGPGANNKRGSGSGKATYRLTKGLKATVNDTLTPVTVTWSGLTLPPRKGMRFVVQARVDQAGVTPGMPLVFAGGAFQQLPVNGLPYCTNGFVNQTVLVNIK